jgi:NADPH:quinone reductase-like Zn-dependent oxidoreductase
VIEHVYPLEDARQAHEQSQTGRTRGKIVLRIA